MEPEQKKEKKDFWLPASIFLAAGFVGFSLIYSAGVKTAGPGGLSADVSSSAVGADLIDEVVLPARWNDLGARLVAAGVIDAERFLSLYPGSAAIEASQLLFGKDNGSLRMTAANAGLWLNLLWALGLGNRNEILEKGEMANPAYGGAGGFASTGGWTIAQGDPMNHYSAHSFMELTVEQQALAAAVAKNIYRPCCDNPTHFPDCNHGMAMLGLLELLASQNATEEEMYQAALAMNSFWFPEQYEIIGRYLAGQDQSLAVIDPQAMLGRDYSSASGFRRVAAAVPPAAPKGRSGGCSI